MRSRLSLALLFAAPAFLGAQRPTVTADDYARAERFLAPAVAPLVSGVAGQPTWLPDDRFWYRVRRADGVTATVLVDPRRRTRTDCTATPAACSGVSGLPGDNAPTTPAGMPNRTGRPEVRSPDGTKAVFIRDWNLWMRDVATNRETQLTTDGVTDYGYATDNAGWVHSDRPVVRWSPDSKKIATFQQDQRRTGEMYLLLTAVGRPVLDRWKYPLPIDSVITMIERVIIDVSGPAPKTVRFQMAPDQHRSTVCDHIFCDGEFADTEWYPDGSALAFVSSTRDHKTAVLRIADATTGAVRDVLRETVATQFESGDGTPNWRVLPATNEVLWYSERDDWGQLYLYDLTSGVLKRKITSGEGNVASIVRIDAKARTITFIGQGKVAGHDPYYRHLHRVSMNGGAIALLTAEDADHDVSVSPSGRYIVDTYSTPSTPPVTVLRDAKGTALLTLDRADVSKLVATGWKPPQRITVKARDGKTDLYGLLYTPTRLDSARKYPIVNKIYPGPQIGSVGSYRFIPARGDNQALAELGFVVVEIDGMGTPFRSKSFKDFYYGRMSDNTIPDQVAGMKELAQRHRFIDVDRAGIWGHSGGGFATASAMFRQPDFFKVGIAESGNHDQRNYEDDWGERYQGLLTRGADGPADSYVGDANQTVAGNLKGKLLLAHGTLDDNVPPDNTMLVVEALIRANKDFDLLLLPNERHGFGRSTPYMMRRRWDYFVQHLMGATPPKEYEMGRRNAAAGR
ncbi:MAG: S9 family peptidase [Gemmatimonadaceae bacterium]|jgi:dipeptidyl aminopeptidase/acylaminoacyl peptidase|nr:S9 family peptidase [Gemmatimonadaceae bacterium]